MQEWASVRGRQLMKMTVAFEVEAAHVTIDGDFVRAFFQRLLESRQFERVEELYGFKLKPHTVAVTEHR